MLSNEIEGVTSGTVEAQETTDAIGRDDFLKMLIAQLENQDPLNPQDPTEFTAQLATFSNLEQLIGVREGVDRLVEIQAPDTGPSATDQLLQSLTATSLVGKDVLAVASHFEVGEEIPDGGVPLQFELAAISPDVSIQIRDERGFLIAEIPDAAISPDNQALAQGTQTVHWDGHDLSGNEVAPGVYEFEVTALDASGAPVPAQTLLDGHVTGAGMGEEPILFLGEVAVPLSNVIEVREVVGSGS